MNSLQVFNFNNATIRTVELNGEVFFVAKDLCDALEILNNADTLKRVDEDDIENFYVTDSIGRKQLTKIVNESGLYSIILQSNKPEAKVFKKWITSEVLPSIRKTGFYSIKNKVESDSYNIEALKMSLVAWNGLNMNDNSKLGLTHKLFTHLGVTTVGLPDYTVSVDVLRPISFLLKEHGIEKSAMKFNIDLFGLAILEKKTRKTTKGEKDFWSISEKYKDFGENQVSPANPRETQPMFYENKFKDLLKIIEQNKPF